jgi:atypical dual specificity phosphatase
VNAIVSLNETELDWAALAPLQHLREPVVDYRAPSLEQMARIEDFWIRHRGAGIVCVHCNAGMGRTGTVLCCLLLCEDSSLDARSAIARLRALRPGSVQTRQQEEFVNEWAASLVRRHKVVTAMTLDHPS